MMGRGPAITEERKRAIRELAAHNPSMTQGEIAMVAGCSVASVSKILAPPPDDRRIALPSPLKRSDVERIHGSLEEIGENAKTAVRYLNLLAVMISDALFSGEDKDRYEGTIKRIAGTKEAEGERRDDPC